MIYFFEKSACHHEGASRRQTEGKIKASELTTARGTGQIAGCEIVSQAPLRACCASHSGGTQRRSSRKMHA